MQEDLRAQKKTGRSEGSDECRMVEAFKGSEECWKGRIPISGNIKILDIMQGGWKNAGRFKGPEECM